MKMLTNDADAQHRTHSWVDRVFGSFVRAPAWRPGTQQLAYEWFESRGNIFQLELRQP